MSPVSTSSQTDGISSNPLYTNRSESIDESLEEAKEKGNSEKVKEKTYCICKVGEDGGGMMMLECSSGTGGCNGWVHPVCMSMSQRDIERARSAKRWKCPMCTGALFSLAYQRSHSMDQGRRRRAANRIVSYNEEALAKEAEFNADDDDGDEENERKGRRGKQKKRKKAEKQRKRKKNLKRRGRNVENKKKRSRRRKKKEGGSDSEDGNGDESWDASWEQDMMSMYDDDEGEASGYDGEEEDDEDVLSWQRSKSKARYKEKKSKPKKRKLNPWEIEDEEDDDGDDTDSGISRNKSGGKRRARGGGGVEISDSAPYEIFCGTLTRCCGS